MGSARGCYLRGRALEFHLAAAAAGQDDPAFGRGHTSPDTVGLRLEKGVFTAFEHDRATGADPFRGLLAGEPGRGRLLRRREEQPRFVTAAGGLRVPRTAQVPWMAGRKGGIRDGLNRLKHGKLLTTARRLPRLPVADRSPGRGCRGSRAAACSNPYPLYATSCAPCSSPDSPMQPLRPGDGVNAQHVWRTHAACALHWLAFSGPRCTTGSRSVFGCPPFTRACRRP